MEPVILHQVGMANRTSSHSTQHGPAAIATKTKLDSAYKNAACMRYRSEDK